MAVKNGAMRALVPISSQAPFTALSKEVIEYGVEYGVGSRSSARVRLGSDPSRGPCPERSRMDQDANGREDGGKVGYPLPPCRSECRRQDGFPMTNVGNVERKAHAGVGRRKTGTLTCKEYEFHNKICFKAMHKKLQEIQELARSPCTHPKASGYSSQSRMNSWPLPTVCNLVPV